MDIGGPGCSRVNFLGYGMRRFYDGGVLFGVSGQTSGAGFDQLGFAQPQDVGKNTEHSYSLADDCSWVRGSMTCKLGFSASHLQLNRPPSAPSSAGATSGTGIRRPNRPVRPTPSAASPPVAPPRSSAGDKLASFMLGIPEGTQVQTENLAVPYYYRWLNLGGYVQNDWKVSPNLTLNIGPRYQFQSPRWEKLNRQVQSNLSRLDPNPFIRDLAGIPFLAPVFEYAGIDGRSTRRTPISRACSAAPRASAHHRHVAELHAGAKPGEPLPQSDGPRRVGLHHRPPFRRQHQCSDRQSPRPGSRQRRGARRQQPDARSQPACVARALSLSSNFSQLNANSIQSRIVQFALKFYWKRHVTRRQFLTARVAAGEEWRRMIQPSGPYVDAAHAGSAGGRGSPHPGDPRARRRGEVVSPSRRRAGRAGTRSETLTPTSVINVGSRPKRSPAVPNSRAPLGQVLESAV